jgi:DnaJ family protein C protein 13
MRLILNRFLPVLFVDAMKDSPQTAVHLFDGTQENPELIWNDEYRHKVCSNLKTMTEELFQAQVANPMASWKLPEDFELTSPMSSGEIVVAGVYLRLFVENPSWVLRRPKEFLTELLDAAQALMSKQTINENHLELVTKALTSLLNAQPALLDMVPIMGHIQGFINNLSSKKNSEVAKSCLLVLRQLANSKQCVDSMVGYQTTLHQVIIAMKSDSSLAAVACEALDRMFQKESEELVHQAVKAELVPFLLNLLDSKQSSHSSSIKAVVVQVLNSMLGSESYGEQIRAILEKSSVWSEFKDQKHDLFISNTPTAGYLTGGTANVAGYLTQGSPVQMPSSPPPMEEY